MTRLLVVDDDPDVRELLVLSLLGTGWEVDSVGAGDQALARADRVDGILLDLEMPGLSGRDVLLALAGRVPVVVITAAARDPVLEAELVALGALAVLAKPFDPLGIGEQVGRRFGWVTTTGGPPAAPPPAGSR
ncbi:response regulator [Saccharothrix sp. Mg75]|uniref:response regulator n=1 Tax=Saccharothrix sp. Mg75 TaxID=3445357 RepID=UPI003EEF9842